MVLYTVRATSARQDWGSFMRQKVGHENKIQILTVDEIDACGKMQSRTLDANPIAQE